MLKDTGILMPKNSSVYVPMMCVSLRITHAERRKKVIQTNITNPNRFVLQHDRKDILKCMSARNISEWLGSEFHGLILILVFFLAGRIEKVH